jgi:hypothetical protein
VCAPDRRAIATGGRSSGPWRNALAQRSVGVDHRSS